MRFNPSSASILVGDSKGNATVYKLSPNLRKAMKDNALQGPSGLDKQIEQMDKLLESVKEVPHVPLERIVREED